MNTVLWIIQIFLAFTFIYSGICKSIYPIKTLVSKGQTGVEDLPLGMVRFIGVIEILGSFGLILPRLLNIYPTLVSISAVCLGLIMIPAGIIHYKRKEYKTVIGINFIILILCVFVACCRQ